MMLFAVHISDGVLRLPWVLGGFVIAGVLLLVSLWRVRDEEVPRIALLTAAFFIVSLMHLRVGPTSVHLLFNGLVGVLLGRRATLAIGCGLFLQFQYLGHGGITALGVNACVLTLPALGAWLLFHALYRLPALRRPWSQSLLVVLSAFAWTLSLIFSITLLETNSFGMFRMTLQEIGSSGASELVTDAAWARTLHPATLAITLVIAIAAAVVERRLENAPEFALGLLIGMLAVLGSVALNCGVLLLGSETPHVLPLALLVVHLPIAVFEGIVLGFTLGFLAKVKPEMLAKPIATRPRPGSDAQAPAPTRPPESCSAPTPP